MGKKMLSGAIFPQFTLPKVGGGELQLGGKDIWQLLIVYRGRHCPLCKEYLNKLDLLMPDFTSIGVYVSAVSSDPLKKAELDYKEFLWSFDIGCELDKSQMDKLGLYVSDPRSAAETDRQFPEPALFVIRPDGCVQIIEISNSPIVRADLSSLHTSLKWVIDNNYPVRGTVV
ncbi:MAG: thioredoxin peroxidase [Gammaproteobacteria bacterium]|nr:thioredoxin peroxidase [Gammaproteobacteria bacterium]